MRLLVISREFPPYVAGGISYHLHYLYSEIADLGHDVTILAGRPRTVSKQGSIEVDEKLDIQWVDFYSLTGYHLQFPLSLRKKLNSVDIEDYDVALTHTEVPFSLGIPTIHKIHDAKHIERSFSREQMGVISKVMDSTLAASRRLMTQRALNCADALIFNSDLTQDVWNNKYDITAPSTTIYNGVDRSIFHPRDVVQENFVLFVGNSPRKGLPQVESYAENSPYPIYVIGDAQGVDNVHTLGRLTQEELAEYYSSAIATIHPANFEAFGNVVLESLACGTPVVVSDQCGASEIIDHTCGRVTTDLDSGIERVKDLDPDDCVRVASQFDWSQVAAETTSLIRQTI
ncbi:glycosyltransferase family 4 protein [Haloferax sp. KTX1]|uniref:glycosyltransferase family 4 protein n=1 Tax=Haloferax sp. KTX1 TaxID=2600597 RepID=UPI0011DCAF75|nr:glycosyltransferase family 4 protein [Haloferax sp. KTX1]